MVTAVVRHLTICFKVFHWQNANYNWSFKVKAIKGKCNIGNVIRLKLLTR